jgi:hypothetical protein
MEFLGYLDSLKPYLVEFDENGDMKDKEYPLGCFPGSLTQRPIIMLTHDESTFQTNDGRTHEWMKEDENPLRSKGRGRGIMVSDFLLPYSRLSTAKLSAERRSELNLPLNALNFSNMDLWEMGIGELRTCLAIPATSLYRCLRLSSPGIRYSSCSIMLEAMRRTQKMLSWYRI